jgi:hypothetical protein
MGKLGYDANEQDNYSYSDADYLPFNTPTDPNLSRTQNGVLSINRWQSLIPVDNKIQEFLHPYWGNVHGFALNDDTLTVHNRDGIDFKINYDPGMPPLMIPDLGGMDDDFKWTFALVAIWSSHIDPENDDIWDISPASKGNAPFLSATIQEFRDHYDLINRSRRRKCWKNQTVCLARTWTYRLFGNRCCWCRLGPG